MVSGIASGILNVEVNASEGKSSGLVYLSNSAELASDIISCTVLIALQKLPASIAKVRWENFAETLEVYTLLDQLMKEEEQLIPVEVMLLSQSLLLCSAGC